MCIEAAIDLRVFSCVSRQSEPMSRQSELNGACNVSQRSAPMVLVTAAKV
eukprot:CAMPEP_0115769226 /NCGR_PEP_ID=MMETSP0272-20121206/104591_1 /TAXON_ID=71861 /ORGANISM="Scrippsiella trochoidea, Strain CCMP3099" /LENGTH=49 /DNA_ID=CAMNT_0003215287 /DNA_START=367 /DNA_END=516 /DNA_ORIENTATION=-